jgi:pilus assembly protein CpaE
MWKSALIVGESSGTIDSMSVVLKRFGFGTPDVAPELDGSSERLTSTHYDLVFVPVHDLDQARVSALESAIREAPSTSFIGTAPKADPDVILRAMRSGVHEFLVTPPDAGELAVAVDRLTRRQQGDVRRGAVFAVYGSKGGLGNTTLAVNLAHALAHNNPSSRVALADLVISSGDVRVLLNLKPLYDIGSVAQKLDRLDADLLNSLLTRSGDGVWVLPGTEDPELDDVLDAAAVSAIIEELRSNFSFTVLDCEHHLSERTLAALDAADKIILNTQLAVPAMRAAQQAIQICERLGYPDDKLFIVVNRHQSTDVLTAADAASLLRRDIEWKLPNDYQTAAAALMKGLPVVQHDASSKLAWSYSQLAAKLGGGTPAHHANGNGSASRGSRLRRMFGFTGRS